MTKRAMLLEALASTPADVERLVLRLDEAAAGWSPVGGWSCHDVVSHLGYVEALYLARLQRIAAEDVPLVPMIHPNESAHDRTVSIVQLCHTFRTAREATLSFLQALSPGGWQRAAIHESKGRTTLRYLVQDLVAHDIDHTNQIVEILAQRRAAARQAASGAGQTGS